jgi:hypothetical protein
LHNDGFITYSSPNIIGMMKSRRIGLTGNVAQMGLKEYIERMFVGKPEEKRPLGRP